MRQILEGNLYPSRRLSLRLWNARSGGGGPPTPRRPRDANKNEVETAGNACWIADADADAEVYYWRAGTPQQGERERGRDERPTARDVKPTQPSVREPSRVNPGPTFVSALKKHVFFSDKPSTSSSTPILSYEYRWSFGRPGPALARARLSPFFTGPCLARPYNLTGRVVLAHGLP